MNSFPFSSLDRGTCCASTSCLPGRKLQCLLPWLWVGMRGLQRRPGTTRGHQQRAHLLPAQPSTLARCFERLSDPRKSPSAGLSFCNSLVIENKIYCWKPANSAPQGAATGRLCRLLWQSASQSPRPCRAHCSSQEGRLSEHLQIVNRTLVCLQSDRICKWENIRNLTLRQSGQAQDVQKKGRTRNEL